MKEKYTNSSNIHVAAIRLHEAQCVQLFHQGTALPLIDVYN